MKAIFSGNELYKGFNLAASIVPASAMKQILQGVKLEVVETGLKPVSTGAVLTATDLEIWVKYLLPVKDGEGKGGIVLPANRTNNILREWSENEEVSLTLDEGTCTLRSRGGYFKILGDNPEQFPHISKTGITHFVEMDGEVLGKMVEKVSYAASTIKALSIYNGIFVDIYGDNLVMVGSDMNRLAMIKRKVDNPEGLTMSGIVAVKSLTFLQRFVSECKGTVKIGIGESQIQFITERGEVLSPLIEGRYPDYEEAIPKNNEIKIEVDKKDLLSTVKMASFVTTEEYRIIDFVLKPEKLAILSKAANVGEAELEIPVHYDGPEYTNTFNPDHIMDILKVSEGETIAIELGGPNDAALFKTGHEQLNITTPMEWK